MKKTALFMFVWLAAGPIQAADQFQVVHAFRNSLHGPDAIAINPNGILFGTVAPSASGGPNMKYAELLRVGSTGAPKSLRRFDLSRGGSQPGIVEADGVLYGTLIMPSVSGGQKGQLFRMNVDGSGYRVLYIFSGDDGNAPIGTLISEGSSLYGLTQKGGGYGHGLLFRIEHDGKSFKVLHRFGANEGRPLGGLVSVGGSLYGTMLGAPLRDYVFRIDKEGANFGVVHRFQSGGESLDRPLDAIGAALYGSTASGTEADPHVVFHMKLDGSDYGSVTNLPAGEEVVALTHAGSVLFGSTRKPDSTQGGGIFRVDRSGSFLRDVVRLEPDGLGAPTTALVARGGLLYAGTRRALASDLGATFEAGGLFKIAQNGTDLATLWDSAASDKGSTPTSLVESGGQLFGITIAGGAHDGGTVFRMNASGSGLVVLHHFTREDRLATANGARTTLTVADGVVWGSAPESGADAQGFAFKVNVDGTGYEAQPQIPEGTAQLLTADNGLVIGSSTQDGVFFLAGDGSPIPLVTSADGSEIRLLKGGGAVYGLDEHVPGGCHFLLKMTDGESAFTQVHDFEGATCRVTSLTYSAGVLFGLGATDTNAAVLFRLGLDGNGLTEVATLDAAKGGRLRYPSQLVGGKGAMLYGTVRGGQQIFQTLRNGTGTAVVALFTRDYNDGHLVPGSDGALYGLGWDGPRGGGYVYSLFADQDADGVSNLDDNCFATPNPSQADTDGDNHGDACQTPRLTISDAAPILEKNTGTTSIARFGVSLSWAYSLPVTAAFHTIDGSAKASDYLGVSGLLTIAAGQTERFVGVKVNGDATVEPDENFFLELTNPTNAILTRAKAEGTIKNDD